MESKPESIIDTKNIWTKEQEELLAEWADIASCYNWMHLRGEQLAANKNIMITVPSNL